MLDPKHPFSRPNPKKTKQKKPPLAPLTVAPVQSQDAKDARVGAIKIPRISHLAVLASWRFLPFRARSRA